MWASSVMRIVTVRRVKMVTANMFLSVFFLSGALAVCPQYAALFITTPTQMEALSGSCLQIPCNFSASMDAYPPFDARKTIHGIWMKNTVDLTRNPGAVIFDSSKPNNNNPKSAIGNLSEKNCTTFFPSITTDFAATYYFRIQNVDYKATAICDPLEIKVTESAPRPRIEISGAVGVNDLKEKQSVTITCSASTPCPHSPPELTWTLHQNPQNIREQNTDRTFTTKIQETITLSDTHDGLTISCSAGYPVDEGRDVKTAAGEITLSVSYAPRDTLAIASPSGLVSAGTLVNLTCSSRAKPPISSFTWFRNSNDGAIRVFEGEFFRLNVTEGGDYHCVATNDLGNEKSVIHLGIQGSEHNSLLVGTVLGVIIGLIVLISLLVFFWRLKSTQKTQGLIGAEATASKMEEEDIHYGEIDFSKRKPVASSAGQDSGQQQETLYAEVKVSKRANSFAAMAEGPEALYAQVKRK